VGVSLGVRDELELTERLIEDVRDGLGVSVLDGVGEDVREGLPESEYVLLIEDEGDTDADILAEGVLENVCD
jgi:hypothetical protein